MFGHGFLEQQLFLTVKPLQALKCTSNGTLQFDDYNYAATTGDSGNYVTTSASGYSTNKIYLTSRGYVQVGSGTAFDLPETNGYYTHFGVAETTNATKIIVPYRDAIGIRNRIS